MLNAVPLALRTAARNTVLRHPNAFDCVVMRRENLRTVGAEAGTMGGEQTLGGMGMMDADDEPQTDYAPVGDGKMLFNGIKPPSTMSNAGDVSESEMEVPVEALIEPLVDGGFTCKDSDLVMIFPGGGVVITFEVTKPLTSVHIPPYVAKFEVQAQGDLMHVPGIATMVAARAVP